jgi:hypothetical protein
MFCTILKKIKYVGVEFNVSLVYVGESFNLNPKQVDIGEILRNTCGWGIKLGLPKKYTQPTFVVYDKIQVLHTIHLNLISYTPCLSLLVHMYSREDGHCANICTVTTIKRE